MFLLVFSTSSKNVDFAKIFVSLRREHDFQGFEFRKINKKSMKNRVKLKSQNNALPKFEKINFRSHFGLPKPSFFQDFGNRNEDGFLQRKLIEKSPRGNLPNPPQS